MKKIFSFSFLLLLIAFLSACSQTSPRSVNRNASAYAYHQARQPSSPQPGYQNQRPQPQQSPVANTSPARNLMVKIAKSTIGTPYKWGGNNPRQGFDCSGLMTYIHKNALGMSIPRVAANQRDNSRTISYEELQPGDMLFFKTGVSTNHVGIYIGNRKFVHAPSSGKFVKVATMDSPYWYKRFVKFGTFL